MKKLTDLSVAFRRYTDDGIKCDGIILNEMTKTYQGTEGYKLKDKKFLTNDFLLKLIKRTDIS